MLFSLTAAGVADYAAKPFIRQALANPLSEVSVRSFFLGIDCGASNAPELLRGYNIGLEGEMANFWYAGHPDYDDLCRNFTDAVRKAGNEKLQSSNTEDDEWSTIDGKFARILLCDHLSRNCFRGSDEAFQYDDVALTLAREMAKEALSNGSRSNDIYGIYASVLTLPLMHSELLSDHRLCGQIADWGEQQTPDLAWGMKKGFILSHTNVIEKFGRYPHRNAKKGRATTQEEKAWLESPECPPWAKSQL